MEKVFFVKIIVEGSKPFYKGAMNGWKRSVEAFPLSHGYPNLQQALKSARAQIKAFRDDGWTVILATIVTVEYSLAENAVGELDDATGNS